MRVATLGAAQSKALYGSQVSLQLLELILHTVAYDAVLVTQT